MSSVKIFEERKVTRKVFTATYPIIKITQKTKNIKIKEVLPFRVRFTNIGIPGYSATYPAPVGIAIIGISNYIL